MDWDTRVGCYAWIERPGPSGAQVLLTRWRDEQLADGRHVRGGWTLPGGGLELRETPESAVVREVEEETGYAVRLTSTLGSTAALLAPHDRMRPDGERFLQLVSLLWTAEVTGGELSVEVGGSSDDARWVDLDGLDDLPCTQPVAEALRRLGRPPLRQPMLGWEPVDEAAVAQVVGTVRDRLAARGPGVRERPLVVAVDGPSGSGKSVLGAVAARDLGAGLVRMDDLFPGWDGLAAAPGLLAEQVLAPLARGERAAYRRWDWHQDGWAEEVEVPAGEVLVVEGCGSSVRPAAELVDVAVWVEAPRELRLRRGLARDGESYRPHWQRWADQEAALYAADRTRERADVVVSTG